MLSNRDLKYLPKQILRKLYSSTSIAGKQRVVIIGGVAGGATAAARLNRLTNDFDVTILERSPDVSFANCGLPYYLGGEIRDRNKLALQTPQSLQQQLGVKVHTLTEATRILRDQKLVEIRDIKTGQVNSLPFDKLILSPGASPIVPKNVPGVQLPHVFTLRNLQDMDKLHAAIQSLQPDHRRVTVIGAGFIGLEVAEQLRHVHCDVTLVERAPSVLPQADADFAEFLHTPLQEHGVHLVTNDGLVGIERIDKDSIVSMTVNLASGKSIESDLVVLCIGVAPESQLAKDCGLNLTQRGHVVVNEFMQTNDSDIYAVGDVISTKDIVFPQYPAAVALGNLANMQARVAADHLFQSAKGNADKVRGYSGSLGTSIVRVFDSVLALTGWTETRLRQQNIPYSSTVITAFDHASYYPEATPITMKLTYCPNTGRVFGAQAVGVDGAGVDKRIDVAATAITGGMTIDDLSQLQLCYSPPFGSARDVVNVAGLAARNRRDNLVHPTFAFDEAPKTQKEVVLLDVRPKESAQIAPLPQKNVLNIPYKEIKNHLAELLQRKDEVEYRTICAWGKTAYFASRELEKVGLNTTTLIGGLQMHRKPLPDPTIMSNNINKEVGSDAASGVSIKLDCTGMACPGPLLQLRESLASMPPGSSLSVTATDPGFKADVKAFAAANNLVLKELNSSKGVIHALLSKPSPGSSQTTPSTTPLQKSTSDTTVDGRRKGATLVVFSEEFDKVLASFVIANGAAAMGGEVTMFFTFWGLNALKKSTMECSSGKEGNDKDVMDRMFGAMMPSGPDSLPLSHFNFGGLGASMMKHVMNKKNLPNLPGLLEAARKQNIRLVACTMSMDAMGIRQNELIDGVELGGVAEYLNAAEKTGTNLFI